LITFVLGFLLILIAIAILAPPSQALPFLPLTLILPFGNLPLHSYFGVLTASTVFLCIILSKVLFESIVRDLPLNKLGSLAFINSVCVVIIALGPVHSINPLRSTGIGLAIIVNFYFIQSLRIDTTTSSQLVKILRILTISLSIYAVLEFIAKKNWLYGELYASANVSVVQEWSVYRVTTLIGHPLSNATVFGCVSLYFFLTWISTNSKNDLIAFGLPAFALGLTAARGSIILYLLCIAIILIFFPGVHQRAGRYSRIIATVNVFIFGLFILFRGIEQYRFNTKEGSESTQARLLLLKRASEIIPSNPFGFGPGTAQEYFKSNSNTKLIVENSLFELFLGFGVIGGTIICLSTAIVLFKFFRLRSFSAVPFLFVLTSSFTYNFLEGNRSGYALFGLLYLLKDFKPNALYR